MPKPTPSCIRSTRTCARDESDRAELKRILRAGRVYGDQRIAAMNAFLRPPLRPEAVERILIHLDRQSPPSRFKAYGPRLVPFFNYLQAAYVLCEDGRLSADAVVRVSPPPSSCATASTRAPWHEATWT